MKKLTTEIAILQQYYQNTYDHVKDNEYYRLYADEKIRHSLQVIGAGNYIIKHEPTFKNKNSEYIRCARLAYLFHDIGRFQEIRELYDDEKSSGEHHTWKPAYDHGEYGYNILKTMQEYNDIRIILPIKHHGHMIGQLYEDPEYINISNPQIKKEIEEIIFLVRDADKTANLYLIKHDRHEFEKLFYNDSNLCQDKFISPIIWTCFENCMTIDNRNNVTIADRILGIIAWVFDMNYKPSFDYAVKGGGFDFLVEIIAKFINDDKLQEKIANILKNYITLRYEQFKENNK